MANHPTLQECIDGLVAHVTEAMKTAEFGPYFDGSEKSTAPNYDDICEWTTDTHELEIRYAVAEALGVSTD
jgi:hypothetical protein